LIAEVFGISKEGMGMPQKVPATNSALKYFAVTAHKREGWKFLDCQDDELRDVLRYLVPLINPMKPARITGKLANSVVESLYMDKKVSWARVLEEVIGNQIRLLGPTNLHSSLAGYLAPIYFAKGVLTRAESQAYWLTKEGGDPDKSLRQSRKLRTSRREMRSRYRTI
jgi:hypothetical protein